MTETTTTRREVQIDTRLAELYGAGSGERQQIETAKVTLQRALRHQRTRGSYGDFLYVALDTVIEEAVNRVAAAGFDPYETQTVTKALDTIKQSRENLARIAAEQQPLEAEYNQAPWSRFFLVQNTNGHIHSSLQCSTCNRNGERTSFAWLPTLSGLTEQDAVEEHGSILCTVCYPTAPVEWTNGTSKVEQAAKDERAAAKAERDAAKAAKAITNPDGTALRIQGYGEIKTERTARIELVDSLVSLKFSGAHEAYLNSKRADIEILVAALAHKTGETPEMIKAEAEAKATAKARKEGWS